MFDINIFIILLMFNDNFVVVNELDQRRGQNRGPRL